MKRFLSLMLLALLAMFAIGCSNVAASYCERLDECNFLAAGKTVNSCTEETEKILDSYTSGKRSDCEKAMDECLSKSDCTNFVNCVNAMGC